MKPKLVLALALPAAALAASTTHATQEQQSFRASAEGVSAYVTVVDKGDSVEALAPDAFLVRDNGVRQQIQAVSAATLPLDVSLVVDMSFYSVVRPTFFKSFESFRKDIQEIAKDLRDDDRLQVVTFGATVQEVRRLRAIGSDPSRLELSNSTAGAFGEVVTDALSAALTGPVSTDRSHLVVLFSEGEVRNSTVPEDLLPEIARASGAVLFVVLPPQRAGFQPLLRAASLQRDLKAAAETTGGEVYRGSGTFGELRDVLRQFRAGYVLRYTAQGVPRAGWHDITVTVPSCPTCTIHARKGYFGQ